jgi:hypothetical protein
MRDFFFQNRRIFLIVTFLVVAFFGATILIQSVDIFVSPDETANAYFSQQFAQTGTFGPSDAYNEEVGNTLYPRSMLSFQGRLVPSGFIGLPVLYGALGSLFGFVSIPWITLVISLLAVASWYFTMNKLFPKRVAFLSTLLLATHPAWWYYTARSLMPNVLFVALLLFGAFFLIVRPFKAMRNGYKFSGKKLKGLNRLQRKLLRWWMPIVDLFFAAGLLGAAVFVRPSEVFWMALVGVCLAIVYWSREQWKTTILFLLLFLIALGPMFYYHEQVYGGYFTTGYTIGQTIPVVTEVATEVASTTTEAQLAWYAFLETTPMKILFPFGVHPRNALQHMGWYLVSLFWWLSLLAIPGFFLLLVRGNKMKPTRVKHRTYALVFFLLLGWLGMMYGSWSFHDNPDPSAITIANSYVRYWLPLYVMSTPLMALSIHWLASRATVTQAKTVAVVGLMAVCIGLNIFTVFWDGDDSLVVMSETLERSQEIRVEVLMRTEEDSVIVVDRADKLFFPYRYVRYPLRDETTYQLIPVLLETRPVYYYGISFPQDDLNFLNGQKLPALGVQIQFVQEFGQESLYQFLPL